MRPGRIVIGCDDEQAALNMRALYAPFQRNHDRLIVMDVRSAELTQIRSECHVGYPHQLHERIG